MITPLKKGYKYKKEGKNQGLEKMGEEWDTRGGRKSRSHGLRNPALISGEKELEKVCTSSVKSGIREFGPWATSKTPSIVNKAIF